MTLAQKREVVRRFKAGERIYEIVTLYFMRGPMAAEQVLRDYLNGKFELKPKKQWCDPCHHRFCELKPKKKAKR